MDNLDWDRAVEIFTTIFCEDLSAPLDEFITPAHDTPFETPVLAGRTTRLTEDQVRKDPEFFVQVAQANWRFQEELIKCCRDIRKKGGALPKPVVTWLVDLKLELVPDAKAPKRDKSDRVQGLVFHSVAALILLTDLKATRNDEVGIASNLPERRSASDLVSKAFLKCSGPEQGQLPTSYDRVKKIWNSSRRLHRFDPTQYREFAKVNPSRMWSALEAIFAKNQ